MKNRPLIALLLALAISGCHSGKKVSGGADTPLKNVQWNLTAIEGRTLDSAGMAAQPHIVFLDDGSFHGSFGCNSFFGDYFQKKQKIELTYKGATKRLCPDMDPERSMMKALKRDIRRFEVAGNTLTLYEGTTEVMRFEDSGERVKTIEVDQ